MTKNATIGKVGQALIPDTETSIYFAKRGFYVVGGAYINNMVGNAINAYLPVDKIPNLPIVSKPTLARGIGALAMNFGYNMIPSLGADLPIVGKIDVKEGVKYATAGAFASFFGSLVIDVVEFIGVDVPASIEQAIR